jgi:large subunit ribosomal protein L1
MKLTKKKKSTESIFNKEGKLSLDEALDFIQNKLPRANFIEPIDVAIQLGIDPKKSDQNVRGSVVLPHNVGKAKRIAVFSLDAKDIEDARKAGADIADGDELLNDIKGDKIDFDVLITTPSMMPKLARMGQKLGPKGLMPNPKLGTVTTNILNAVEQVKKGQVSFRAEKGGIIHCTIGKMDLEAAAIKENIISLIAEVVLLKPSSAK